MILALSVFDILGDQETPDRDKDNGEDAEHRKTASPNPLTDDEDLTDDDVVTQRILDDLKGIEGKSLKRENGKVC